MQQPEALAAVLRVVDLGVPGHTDSAGELQFLRGFPALAGWIKDAIPVSAAFGLSVLLEAMTANPSICEEVCGQVAGNKARLDVLARAMERGPIPLAAAAVQVIGMLASSKDSATICIMLADASNQGINMDARIAALARWATRAASRADLIHPASLAAMAVLRQMVVYLPASTCPLLEQHRVAEAVAAVYLRDGARQAEELLSSMGNPDEHSGAVARAVAAALHACGGKGSHAEARKRAHTLLGAYPFRLPGYAIEAMCEVERLRTEVAALEAVPVNTRAAIVELAAAVRGGNGA